MKNPKPQTEAPNAKPKPQTLNPKPSLSYIYIYSSIYLYFYLFIYLNLRAISAKLPPNVRVISANLTPMFGRFDSGQSDPQCSGDVGLGDFGQSDPNVQAISANLTGDVGLAEKSRTLRSDSPEHWGQIGRNRPNIGVRLAEIA